MCWFAAKPTEVTLQEGPEFAIDLDRTTCWPRQASHDDPKKVPAEGMRY